MSHILISDKQHPSVAAMADLCDRTQLRIKWRLDDCTGGKWLFLVSCSDFVPRSVRDLYEHTLVLHASDLPKGRGWSPWVWAIRDGETSVCVCMLEAENSIDSGAIWNKVWVSVDKCAIYEEMVADLTHAQVLLIEQAYNGIKLEPQPQTGEPTMCRKLTDDDSIFYPDLPMSAQWDKLRTCDPNRFPAWFVMHGERYNIRIERAEV